MKVWMRLAGRQAGGHGDTLTFIPSDMGVWTVLRSSKVS